VGSQVLVTTLIDLNKVSSDDSNLVMLIGKHQKLDYMYVEIEPKLGSALILIFFSIETAPSG